MTVPAVVASIALARPADLFTSTPEDSDDAYRDMPADEESLVRRLQPYEIVIPIRERMRPRSRASSGPKASPNRKLATASVMSNGAAAPAVASRAAGVWLAPIVHV